MPKLLEAVQKPSVAYTFEQRMIRKAKSQLTKWAKAETQIAQLSATAYTDFREVVLNCTSKLDDVLVWGVTVDGFENCKAFFYHTYDCSHKRVYYQDIMYPTVKLGDKPNMRHTTRSRGIDDLMRIIKSYPDAFLNCTTLHKFREAVSMDKKAKQDKADSKPKVNETAVAITRLVTSYRRNISKLRDTQYKQRAQYGQDLANSITDTLAK